MRHNSASELTKPAKNVQMPQKASKAVWTLTDEEAHEAQLGERVDEAREERADAAEGQQGRLDLDRAVDVAQRADHEARHDAGRDVKNVRHPDALFGDVEVLADHN